MDNLFTVSTAEQPTDPRWLYVTPQKSVHAPDWSEGARTLFCYTFTALQHAIAYLDLFDAVDDLAPPKPFDPVPHVFQCSECVFCDGKSAASWERLFGWKICRKMGSTSKPTEQHMKLTTDQIIASLEAEIQALRGGLLIVHGEVSRLVGVV